VVCGELDVSEGIGSSCSQNPDKTDVADAASCALKHSALANKETALMATEISLHTHCQFEQPKSPSTPDRMQVLQTKAFCAQLLNVLKPGN
jgi:hypothetical protein